MRRRCYSSSLPQHPVMRPKSCLPCAIYFRQPHSFSSAFAVRFASSSRNPPGRVAAWQLFSKNKRNQFIVNRSKQQAQARAKADRRGARKAQAVTERAKESWDVNESSPARTRTQQWVPKQVTGHTEAANKTTETKQGNKLNAIRADDGPWYIRKNEMKQQKSLRTPLAQPSAAHVPLLLLRAGSMC